MSEQSVQLSYAGSGDARSRQREPVMKKVLSTFIRSIHSGADIITVQCEHSQDITDAVHTPVLSLISACGLRRSELLSLKPDEVDSKRHKSKVPCRKGRTDKVVPISAIVFPMLCAYCTAYRPKEWLVEGQRRGR